MPALGYSQALDALTVGVKSNLWLLVTDNTVVLRGVQDALLNAVVTDFRDFNFHRHDCERKTEAGTLIALCEELPMMTDRRLVWLRDVHQLSEAALKSLAAYLPTASPGTVVFMSAQPKASSRGEEPEEGGGGLRGFISAVQKLGTVVGGTLGGEELARFVERGFAARGVRIAPGVRQMFLTRVGEDASALDSEMDKIACYVGERRQVEQRDVEAITTWTPDAKIFALSDAIARKDGGEALRILGVLIDDEQHPLAILGYLSSQFRSLLKVKALGERGESPARIASLTERKDYQIKKDLAATRRYSVRDLETVLEMLARADLGMKSGKDGRLLLEMLLIHLCR
ncbi:MAG: DNA polymerase III subunit delta [Armatimonadetes bacterium]|nr:DNA polymerase III subunit delta [Armatimonadota bacterium]